ncbi:dna-dependent protein kinase catalytic subunit [Stylonychia lemnae]|uniref:non-specific serine/threonine protein kinase n=1 Tax=Stylonychia lemnae TaxID=5949 RepID=A0A077ZN58_STYLE|nr:dna-dependent protein kinase catalytic subunit [Stylonychia lemnae]|eukprot:CDW71353.1 dna-dependent protein kinase catalytic subunit [Stylonychia lemnae]
MEQKIDELLRQLHKFLFADSEQVVNELRIYILDESLKEADLAFISSKIFNSNSSLLEFLRENSLHNDKLISSVKKKVYELIIDYLKLRSQEATPYLKLLKDTCLRSFRSDHNSLVKESSLQLLIKIIETFNSKEIEEMIRPNDMMVMLLDEIKLRKPSATVKGTIWTLIGLLHEKYEQLNDFKVESQDVGFQELVAQMKSEKPEIKAIIGMLKGFTHSLVGECTLDQDQLDALYVCLKTAIQPILDMQHKGVMKSAMKLLGTHINLFKKHVTRHAIELVALTLKLCVNENMETRDAANEMLVHIMQEISDGITIDSSIHDDIFRKIMKEFETILNNETNQTNVLLISTIKAVGIFSKAIKTKSGDDALREYLSKLTTLSQNKIIKEFEQQEDPKNDYKNFKQILKKQKQLLSFIESYSFIIQNLDSEPSDEVTQHFLKVCEIGVRHHRKLYQKYRDRFYEALASFTKALSKHQKAFANWIQKFVDLSLIQTLKIPDAVLFGGESPYESLQDAVQFWREWLNKDKIWSEYTCQYVYGELIQRVIRIISDLNLTYKVEKGRNNNKDGNQDESNNNNNGRDPQILNQELTGLHQDYIVQYIANNNTDQQFLVRLSNFAEMFLLQCKDQWFLKWIPQFTDTLIKKASQTPRISKLYQLLKVCMQICSNHRYFEVSDDIDSVAKKGEKQNTYNMLLTFFKELIGKQEEYQDELLTSCLDLLLHVPVQILYRQDKKTDNVQNWKVIMQKAIDLGRNNNQLAWNSINMLEQWFNLLPMNVTLDLYHDILPKLSDFLQVDDNKKQKKLNDATGGDTYQYLEMLKSGNEVNIERKDIALKVMDLLGKIGGNAHSIISNEQNKLIERENFIKWDPEKRLKFTVPLYTKKVDIYFDACLPKVVDLAKNSSDRETRVAACEFLHALIIYMIGKNASAPKGRGNQQQQEVAPFAKIYKKLFPVMIHLATEVENISRQLFEPLIFQIVRWFSNSTVYDHPEVESLLEALIDGASSRNNSASRDLCSNAVAEFAKWSLKQMTDKNIKENPNNIKSLIRRIESNSNHPDPFKRLSSVLCFSKIFSVIREHDPLIDRFCMEIAHNVLGSLKMCHNSIEFSQEVIDNCIMMLEKVSKVVQRKISILMNVNPKRSIHQSVFTFILYLFEKFVAIETVCRRESMKLWEAIVRCIPPTNIENMPDNPVKWIFSYYLQRRGEKAIFKRFAKISFIEQNYDDQNDQLNHRLRSEAVRKTMLSEKQKTIEMLTAQIECFNFLLSRKIASFSDIKSKLVDINVWMGNLYSFLADHIVIKFVKNERKSLDKLLICKEDKEILTKSRMVLITQFLRYLDQLDEESLLAHADLFQKNCNFNLIHFCVQIMVIPLIHQLQVLVEDQELERQLRNQSELLLRKLVAIKNLDLAKIIKKDIVPSMRCINLNHMTVDNVQNYHPKMLMSMCLGYLKLASIDPNIKEYLISFRSLPTIVEAWFDIDTPISNESARVLVKFLSKLEIPNETLCEWLTKKHLLYQKSSDLLLSYIAENWNHFKLNVGEYLIIKAKDEPSLYAVFIPILEKLSQKTPNYYKILLRSVPENWNEQERTDFTEFEVATSKVKIYTFIANACQVQLRDRSNHYAIKFIDHLCEKVSKYLKERYPVHIKREVLNLVGMIYNLETQRENEFVHDKDNINFSLRTLQSQFFPIKTRELVRNSNVYNNFHIIVEGFLSLLILSKNLKVLRMIYNSMREWKTTYEPSLKRTLKIIIEQSINKMPLHQFKQTFSQFMDEFMNRQIDLSVDDNLRWAIMKKIILKILESCSQEFLADIMIEFTPQLEIVLKESIFLQKDPLEQYQLIKQKKWIFLVFEVMFRRLKPETIRQQVHKKLYGESSPGNELTKSLIQLCTLAKKAPIDGFVNFVKDSIKSEFPQYNSPLQVQRQYACAAYTCLTAIIMGTQTKENLFSQFLFATLRDKGEECFWNVLIDQEKAYNFEVETNFNYIQLKQIEFKIEQANGGDISQIKANNLINEYNEKFNSAMVFETQPDKINIKSEEEKLQKLLNNKKQNTNQDQNMLDKSAADEDSEIQDVSQLELDNVNKHECMKNIKRCIDKMSELFKREWDQNTNEMPNPQLFSAYAKEWFEPIANYLCDKNNGGKGFHYFMRDLCTLLISWNYIPEEIIAGLLHRWKKLVAINKDVISMMIGMDDKKPESNLWKMTGIQILALAVSFDILVIEKPENIGQTNVNQREFRFQEQNENQLGDKLMNSLLKILESKKKQIIQAASETLGKILNKQPSLVAQSIHPLMNNEITERHDVFVHSIEKITREYPELLIDRKIFMKLLSFVKTLTGSMRASILKSFERFINVCRQRKKIEDINEIAMSLLADSEEILADISDENQQSFLILITQIAKLNLDTGDKLMQRVLPRLKQLFQHNKNDYSRGLFYDLMVYLYDQFENFKPLVKSALIRGLSDKTKVVRNKLISFWSDSSRLGLDPNQRLLQIMNDLYTQEEENIWLNNSVFLLMQICSQSSDFNRKIFDAPLQDCKFQPLEINQFGHQLNRSQPLTPLLSQMDQIFQASQMQAKDQQLGVIKEVQNENPDENIAGDVTMIDTTVSNSNRNQRRPQIQASQIGSQSVVEISDTQAQDGNFVRATQVPVFTQTQSDVSSLIASNFYGNNRSSPPITDSISASFYEINKFNKKRPNQGQVVNLRIGAQSSQDKVADDDDGFIAPVAKRKGKADLAKFFAQNQYVYRPQESQGQGQRIRYVPQGSMPAHLQKQEEIRKMQREQYLQRQIQRQKHQVGLYRRYRVGELPDIQISYEDVLKPLQAITKSDLTIATEVFVEIFSELYKSQNDQQQRELLGQGVRNILNESILYDYGCINCIHRVAMELLKTDGFTIEANIIQRTGQHSMSFQTALALLEESIIHGKQIQDEQFQQAMGKQGNKKRKIQDNSGQNQKNGTGFMFNKVLDGNRKYWFNLIDLYDQIGNDDALQGIWTFLADEEGIIFKVKDDQEKLSQDQERTVNLIKEAHCLRTKGSIDKGLKVLEQALNDKSLTDCLEDHILCELENKQLDSKAELLKWDELAKDMSEKYHSKQLSEIPFKHAEKMIRAQIRTDEYWNNLTKQIAFWQKDQVSKAYLDKNFNYELAINSLTCKDYDRARFYLDKETNELLSQWKNLTKLSQVAQHFLVQRIQKIYEMREFLQSIKQEGLQTKSDIVPQVIKSIHKWMARVPSYAFDTIVVWDDILTARNLYIDLYKFRLKDEFTTSLKQHKDLADIGAILQVQCAKGSYKMGLFDSSDRFLKRALKIRADEDKNSQNMKIVAPIIKLKCEQFKVDTMNLNFADKGDKLQKIVKVFDSKMQESFGEDQQFQEDLRTEIKCILLKQKLEKKMLNIIFQGVSAEKEIKHLQRYQKDCTTYLDRSFKTLDQVIKKVQTAAQFDDQMKKTMAKTYFKFAQFSDKILRKMENDQCRYVITNSLKQLNKSEEQVARDSIKYGLLSLNHEYQNASDIIPRLLDITSKYKDHVQGDFIAYSKETPTWYFLRWINQIVAVVNRPESSVIEEKVIQIAKKYPQALYYPFKVVESNVKVNVLDSDVQKTQLFQKLSKYYEKTFRNLNAWAEALDCLVYPEHRFKYWLQIINDIVSDDNMRGIQKAKLKDIIIMMAYDLTCTQKDLLGDQVGSYNRKFAELWDKVFAKEFGSNLNRVDKMSNSEIIKSVQNLNNKLNQSIGNLGQGYEKLSTFSEWLDSLDFNDFYNPSEYIELPGQYEGLKSEPLIEKNVKIASVKKTLLILGSIRRPKRITVHGSNEKDYHLLIKGGEDLRLDQRVQQLFQIINSIFKDDAQCQNRDLYIKTFKVVPITNRLGTLEWVDDTEPMKSLINREHMRNEAGKDLNQSRALNERRKWLKSSVPGNAKKEGITDQHICLLGCDEKIVIEGFNKHKEAIPWYLLRNGLENLCLTSSAFLAIKNQFTKSLATFSIASYLIGIGDRHLENFLIDTSDGEILGIDFGIAFGSGIQLGIPELMPFRLTQQIEGVIAPHPLEGVYKQTMVHALNALKHRKSLIMDTCEIFVKEPLLDWVKDAKQRQKNGENNDNGMVDSLISEYEEELQELAWYPRKKIEVMKDKLNGLNPVRIMAKELQDSKHEKKPYFKVILNAIKGQESSIRYKLLAQNRRYLEVDEFIDCLIEQSRDPNILGRTWIGWSPYV